MRCGGSSSRRSGRPATASLNTMGLVACEAAYRHGEEWYEAVKAYIRENLAYAQHFLEEQIPQVKAVEPEGTYLLWVDFPESGTLEEELEDLIVKKGWTVAGFRGHLRRGGKRLRADQCGMPAQRADGGVRAARACSAGSVK